MTAKAFETAAPFAEITCRALSAAVLRLSGLVHQPVVPEQALPEELIDGLRELAATDPAWASWTSAVKHCVAQAAQPRDEATRDETTPASHPQAGSRRVELRSAATPRSNDRSGDDQDSADQDSAASWRAIAASLPELLIQYPPASPAAASHAAWSQLQSMCHLVLRLRTLETRFADELERKKREAIYHFAYGLSHELNNPLANIATRGGVLAEQESHPQRKTLLEAIVANAMRGCEMLGDLMLVARPPKLTFKSTRIDVLVTSVVDSAGRWANDLNVELNLDVQSTQALQLDAAALREALWALIRNGLEAMFEGGTISVRVTDCEPLRRQSRGVCIEVSDRGRGLSRAAVEHCFDPYYSGREAGRGLGLGLSKAQRIVQLHGGSITLSNRPGGGVVARILLPSG